MACSCSDNVHEYFSNLGFLASIIQRSDIAVQQINRSFTAEWALRALIDFTHDQSIARRFYSSMGKPLDGKGVTNHTQADKCYQTPLSYPMFIQLHPPVVRHINNFLSWIFIRMLYGKNIFGTHPRKSSQRSPDQNTIRGTRRNVPGPLLHERHMPVNQCQSTAW